MKFLTFIPSDVISLDVVRQTLFALLRSAGRVPRHANINRLIKQTLGSLELPSMLEPRGPNRTDDKQTNDFIMMINGKHMEWKLSMHTFVPNH